MTRDFAKPSTTRKPGKQKGPAKANNPKKPSIPTTKGIVLSRPRKLLAITCLLILIGAFAAALHYLQTIPATNTPLEPQKSKTVTTKPSTKEAKSKAKETTTAEAATEAPEQRFKFYDLLPENKVVTPKVDAYQFKERSQSNDYYYLLQTGSFKKLEDAERQKANIAFLGIKASIQPTANDKGLTWYRVTTEPFYDRSKMNAAMDKLVAIHISPLVKKVKKEP